MRAEQAGVIRRVLLPLDGSELSAQALAYGAAQAAQFEAPITLLRAVDGPERAARLIAGTPVTPGAGVVLPESAVEEIIESGRTVEKEARAYLAAHARRLRGRGIAVNVLIADAPAVGAILEESEREPNTIVVMATHGRGGLGRLVFGSTAEAVLQRARVPILLVRATDTSAS
jgi:nucleotide-binding universal stress UspA family protein